LNLSVGSRNNDEQILSETATVGSTVEPTDSYSYNASDQVSTGPIAGTTGSDSYAYTAQGGIDADTTGFASAAYDQAGVLCWTSTTTSSNSCLNPPSGATTYSTNSDGERTSMTPPSGNPTSYGWDTESGLLTCANTDGSTCSTSNPTSMTTVYTYDGNGLRTSATIGSTTTNFTWGIVAGTSQLFSDGTWDYVYANGSAIPLEQIAASGSSPAADLLLSDESGNVRGLVQLSVGTHQDQLVNYTDYDAYGNPIEASTGTSEAGGVGIPQTGINANYVGSTPWGFGEGYTDPTRLIYLVNRYYDPTTGQFLSVDPEVNVTAEPYEFANDDPVAAVDPSGATFTGGPGSGSQINLPAVAQWATANAPIQAKWDDNGIEPDCTDFASRALSEGGGDPMTYSDDWAWDKLHESNDSLWFEVWNGVGLRAISDSWSEAPHLANHLLGNGSLFVVGEPGGDGLSLGKSNGKPWTGTLPSDVTPGDVIFANLDGVGFDRIDHTGIIVWVNGQCEIAQHTPNYIATFSDWKNHRWMENTSKWETSIWIVMPSPG
jgi:RHS repeat-associated protein